MPESIANLTFQIQSQKISSGGVIWAQSWITLTMKMNDIFTSNFK